ncbi:PduM family microcompartment protein [Pseudaeromonas sp. ZJS20]|uniref:PduM family microcompartment protein n=1 Tax=Pseudaeromonas aegiceratis TaxID=3153928 RepID=UPI00390C4E91
MLALSDTQIATLVEQIVQLLVTRRQAAYRCTLDELANGLPRAAYLYHGTLAVTQVDAPFLRRLAALDRGVPTVAAVLAAWHYGMQVTLSLHPRWLCHVPVRRLANLQVSLCDDAGNPVHLSPGRLLGYRQVSTLTPGWLLLEPGALISPLAADVLAQGHLHWIRTE